MQQTPRSATPEITVQRPAALILIGVLFVLALVTTSAILYWFFYAISFLIALSYFWTRAAVSNIYIRRILTSKSAATGDEIREEIYLTNRGRLPILLIELVDHSTLPGYTASVAENLDARQTKRWFSTGTALRRGLFQLGPMTVRTGDPFGIFFAEFEFPQRSTFVVYPPISVMPDFQIPAGSQFGNTRSLERTQQITSDASTIREFVPGDAFKRIHWLSTARTGRIMVKEFDLEPSAGVWLILDMQRSVHAGSGDESTEEYAVKIASALAYQQIRDGKSVGLAAIGRQRIFLEPQKGTGQLWKILESLAIVSAAGATPFDRFLTQLVPRPRARHERRRRQPPPSIPPGPSPSASSAIAAFTPAPSSSKSAPSTAPPATPSPLTFAATYGVPVRTVQKGARFDSIRIAGSGPAADGSADFTFSFRPGPPLNGHRHLPPPPRRPHRRLASHHPSRRPRPRRRLTPSTPPAGPTTQPSCSPLPSLASSAAPWISGSRLHSSAIIAIGILAGFGLCFLVVAEALPSPNEIIPNFPRPL